MTEKPPTTSHQPTPLDRLRRLAAGMAAANPAAALALAAELDRITRRRQSLDLHIVVRVPAAQPAQIPAQKRCDTEDAEEG